MSLLYLLVFGASCNVLHSMENIAVQFDPISDIRDMSNDMRKMIIDRLATANKEGTTLLSQYLIDLSKIEEESADVLKPLCTTADGTIDIKLLQSKQANAIIAETVAKIKALKAKIEF